MTETPARAGSLGDMSAEEFRRYGYQVVDWISDYLANPDRYPVLSQLTPGQIKAGLPDSPPTQPEDMGAILEDFEKLIMPGVTHWNHPAFFAYFSISGSAPGILGEMLSAALNVNAMLWRTSPSATELEEVTLEWLRQTIGLPSGFSGVVYDTASIATLCAIAAARQTVPGLSVRADGLSNAVAQGAPVDPRLTSVARLRMYTSEQSHSSVEKAAIVLGIGQAGVRKIATDHEYRMDPALLATAIREDRAMGWTPFCVVATVGTTSTTSIDPVPEIADICEREKVWLHVDAAYGGSAAVLHEMKWILGGCDRADSLVINPHKWLFVPFDLSVLYCRHMETLRETFSLVPEYLRTGEQNQVRDYMDYGPQLGRRFRAIKLWFVMRYFGVEGLGARLRYAIELAREFAGWVDASPDFERLAPAPFSTVCFRARPAGMPESALNDLNERLLNEVNQQGKVYLSHTKLAERFTLRLAIGNIRTTRDHVEAAWEQLTSVLARIRDEN